MDRASIGMVCPAGVVTEGLMNFPGKKRLLYRVYQIAWALDLWTINPATATPNIFQAALSHDVGLLTPRAGVASVGYTEIITGPSMWGHWAWSAFYQTKSDVGFARWLLPGSHEIQYPRGFDIAGPQAVFVGQGLEATGDMNLRVTLYYEAIHVSEADWVQVLARTAQRRT